jgi:tetratricopeptide (TPR) repeat protein
MTRNSYEPPLTRHFGACFGRIFQMKSRGFNRALLAGLLLAAISFSSTGAKAQDGPVTNGTTNTASATNVDETLRSYLQLQEQLHSVQMSLEKNRQEAESAAARSAEALVGRLQAIEQSLSAQRARELEGLQSANRWMLVAAGIFAAVGCLTVLCMAYFQWRTVNKLAEISASLPRAFGAVPPLTSLGAGESSLLSVSGPADQSNMRLLGTIERLEKRILEIESSTHPTLQAQSHATEGAASGEPPGKSNGNGLSGERARFDSLLGKGQSLLNLEKAEEAIACFDEILATDPRHAETLMKKAAALDRLGKLDEAVQCCDEAIAADSSLTVAYLYKGGLFNRMERFSEALACYEQALHAKEKGRA